MAEPLYVSIIVTGEDARDFLQNQLTQDLALLGADNPGPLLSAWCNPKGRVIVLMRVSWTDDGFALTLPAELAEAVEKRLTMFRFRSRVEFEISDVASVQPDSPLDALKKGIAHIGTAQSESFTPHMLNLDLLDAVNFEKGCYPGQEIVARTHYRGATKRRMFRFESDEPVAAGDAVLDDSGKSVGEVVNAIGTDLLAVVPVAAADSTLRSGDARLVRQPLPYDTCG